MTKMLLTLALALTLAGAGCAKRVDLEKVPVGTQIEVTRQDGGVVTGSLAARDDSSVRITVGSATRLVPRSQIVNVRLVNETSVAPSAAAKFREFTLPERTRLAVRLETPVGSESSRAEDPIEATLTTAVVIDGTDVLPAGSVVRGTVASAQSSGKVKGRGTVSLLFNSLTVAGQDERYAIAARVGFLAASGKNKDLATIGIGAGGGALLGALMGGGKGAAIGAGIGGGAGTGLALSTRGPQIQLPRGTVLSLQLEQPVDIRVPINKW